jgi:hypothetical protein
MACHLRQAKSRGERQPVAALYAIRFRGYVKQFTRQGRSRLEAQEDVVSFSVIDHLRRRCLQHTLAMDAERVSRKPNGVGQAYGLTAGLSGLWRLTESRLRKG